MGALSAIVGPTAPDYWRSGEGHYFPEAFKTRDQALLLTGGEAHDCPVAERLIRRAKPSKHMLGDKAYDSAELRDELRQRGTNPVIPNRSKPSRRSRMVDLMSLDPSLGFLTEFRIRKCKHVGTDDVRQPMRLVCASPKH
jgi:hypothetical protein